MWSDFSVSAWRLPHRSSGDYLIVQPGENDELTIAWQSMEHVHREPGLEPTQIAALHAWLFEQASVDW